MTIFSIVWANHYGEPEKRIIVIRHPAAPLAVTLCGDLIVNCDWLPDNDTGFETDSAWQRKFDRGWESRQPIAVTLLEQGTVFRRRVWQALCEIPEGEVRSYGALAAALASSPRAVGNACRGNPYAPIVPCHRVVSASGLGGYCGERSGPLFEIKRKLLDFEREFRQ